MEPYTLPANTIDLWFGHLNQPPWPPAELERVLSCAERDKAGRYALPVLQQHAVASRGMLRMLLAAYLGCQPESIPLLEEAHGKPRLDPAAHSDLAFSVTHSEELVLYAIAHCPIGIDIVQVTPTGMLEDYMLWTMSPASLSSVMVLPSKDRYKAAGHIWASKEAIYKALGRNDLTVRDIEVVIKGDRPHVTRVNKVRQEPPLWSLTPLGPFPDNDKRLPRQYISVVCYPATRTYEIRQRCLQRDEVAP